jgi:hypothetical protein
MDLNRDRRLGEREVREAVARVSSWDRNGDGVVSSDEIPHNFQMSIARGQVVPAANPRVAHSGVTVPAVSTAAGPSWFRKMDRNRDGDISRREFLGTRADFDRMDTDKDGLLSPGEAAAVTVAKSKG